MAAAVAKKDEEIAALKEEIGKLSEQINDLEQYSRRQCLNFSGIPEQHNENTDKLIIEIAKSAGVNVKPDDIDVSHRIGKPKAGKPRAIIAKFQSFSKRQEMYGARRELRSARAPRGTSLTPAVLSATRFCGSITRVVPGLSGRSCQPIKDETPSVTSLLAQQHRARQAIAAVGWGDDVMVNDMKRDTIRLRSV